ncbi:hypothetical protein [Sphingomonas xinjiangensis]|uniref:Uncharacterized protein n=1 Tax=Sphingomonas xinjiangensis TaxID=643568 RepID=A0A840YB34_9SPHN|nr:hypothetical protein [Sphingomonas xinjiangensis]MBB5709249.1 hypothetical protein [Sphingomonas xinjiangensis]
MTDTASHHEPETHGGTATAEEGQVMLDGPDGVAVAMSPEAAVATAESLIAAAEQASDQLGAEGHPS